MKEDYSEIQKRTAYSLFRELRERHVWRPDQSQKIWDELNEFYGPELKEQNEVDQSYRHWHAGIRTKP